MADHLRDIEDLKGIVAAQAVLIDELALALARIAPDEMGRRMGFLSALSAKDGPSRGPVKTARHLRTAVQHLCAQIESQSADDRSAQEAKGTIGQ